LLRGGRGDDTLEGESGNDTLRGGRGDDAFVFDFEEDFGHDTVVGGRGEDVLHFDAEFEDFESIDTDENGITTITFGEDNGEDNSVEAKNFEIIRFNDGEIEI
jgi:Ca2+-binding RTX toxin-like protein